MELWKFFPAFPTKYYIEPILNLETKTILSF